MKKILCLTAILLMTATAGYAADKAKAEPDIVVDGSKIIFEDQNAVIVDGVTLVPARGVFEAMGNSVNWDGKKQMVQVTTWTGVRNACLYINNDIMTVTQYKTLMDADTKEVKLEVPAQIMNDRTMIPLRAVSEAFDCEVEWDEENYVVNIVTTDPPLLEGYEHKPKTPIEEMVTMSLSTDAKDVKAGDEFDVYVEVKNMPEDMFVSILRATFKFDKSKLEYIKNSSKSLNNENLEYAPNIIGDNTEYDTGAFALFISADRKNSKSIDGKALKVTFKKLTDEPAEIALNNNYFNKGGYESYFTFTKKAGSDIKTANVSYKGKDLYIDKTPLVIE